MKQRHGWTPYSRVMDQVVERLVVPDLGPCLEFTGHRFPTGYGAVSIKSIPHYAHRIVAEELLGPAPASKPFVLHACDNPPCVEIQTTCGMARIQRTWSKQSAVVGHHKASNTGRASSPKSRCTSYRVDMRPATVIAAEYGIRPQAVSKIRLRQRWEWLPEILIDEEMMINE